jgi:hypothetical protein
VLDNPNYGKDARYLADPALARQQYIESQPSDPTGVIPVPRDSWLLAGPVSRSVRMDDEPKVQVMVVSWVQEQGTKAYTEQRLSRGTVANFPDCQYPEIKPVRTSPRNDDEDNEPRGIFRSATPDAPQCISVNYLTDVTLLDLDGGERLPGSDRLTQPGVILLLEPDGTLSVRHEIEDLPNYREAQQEISEAEGGGRNRSRPQPGPRALPQRDDELGNLHDLRSDDGRSRSRPVGRW